jgi:hypothetical protein
MTGCVYCNGRLDVEAVSNEKSRQFSKSSHPSDVDRVPDSAVDLLPRM